MKYRVIKYFIDRDSLKEFNAGDEFPCENPARAAQLINRCYIERVEVQEPEKEPVEEEKTKEEDPVEEMKEPKKTTAKAKSTAKKAATKKRT